MKRMKLAGMLVVTSLLVPLAACYPLSNGAPAPATVPVEEHSQDELSDSVDAVPAPEQQPGGGVAWNQASSYASTFQRVCGPFAGWGSSNDDVFFNLGLDYPDPGRFQIVIWDIGGVEPIPSYGATLCTAGKITLYNGVAQIELYDPSAIEIYDYTG